MMTNRGEKIPRQIAVIELRNNDVTALLPRNSAVLYCVTLSGCARKVNKKDRRFGKMFLGVRFNH
jgi:hypothetical protein